MDPVSLHAERRGGDGEVEDRDSVAAVELEVTLSAIPDSYSRYSDPVASVEPKRLKLRLDRQNCEKMEF